MTFYTGTLTGGGSAALITKLEDCLALDTTNWEFVEEATVSTKVYRVWKNKGHSWNGGTPFYFYITASNATNFYLRAFEEWDTSTKKCTGLINTASTGSITLDSAGRLAAADPTQTTNGAVGIGSVPTSSTVYTYYIGIGPQGIFIMTSVNTDGGYLGLIEPSGIYSSGEFPLVSIGMDTSPSPKFSRCPGLTGSQSYNLLNVGTANDAAGGIPTGYAQLGGKSVLARRRVSDYYVLRGYLPSWLLISAAVNTGVVTGDTITIGGTTYTLCYNAYRNWVSD